MLSTESLVFSVVFENTTLTPIKYKIDLKLKPDFPEVAPGDYVDQISIPFIRHYRIRSLKCLVSALRVMVHD